MTLFTLGNLITLGLSLLAVLLVRYMDRQNRSVDLAREYGKRLKDEIAGFAEEKAAAVKDYGVELEVQKSSAKELLNRLVQVHGEMDQKAEEVLRRVGEVAQIGDRISAYDKSMEELIRMTSRVDENMNRLKEESAFVEQTARKIGEIKSQAGNLEKDVGNLELRFERENAESLEKTAETLVAQVRERVEELKSAAETVERQVEDHRAAVDRIETERKIRLERDVEIINKTLGEALEKAALRSEKLEDAALVKLREEAMARLHRFQNTVEEKIREYHENAKARVGEIQGLVKSCREEWKQEHEGLEEKQQEQRLAWQQNIKELEEKQEEFRLAWWQEHERLEEKQREYRLAWQRDLEALDALALSQRKQWEASAEETEGRIALLKENLDRKTLEAEEEVLKELEGRLSSYREDQGRQWERFASLADDAERLDGQLRLAMEDAEERVRRDFSLFAEEQKQEQKKAGSAFNEMVDTLKGEVAALEGEINELKNKAYENVSEKLRIFEGDFTSDLSRRSAGIDARLDEWQGALDEKLGLLGETAEAERRSLELSLKGELEKRLEEQGERILTELERLKEESGTFEEKIQNSMDGIESRFSQLSTNAEDIRRELKEFSSQTKLFEKTDELKTVLERSMEALKTDMTGIEARRSELTQLETEFIKIRRLEDEVNTKMTRFLTEKNHLDIMEKDFEKLIQTSQRVEERLKEVNAADDTLQNIQVALRKLEDAIVAAEDKYQRVEKKNQILEETNRGIERNFLLLEEAENALRKCNEDIDKAGAELDSLRPAIEELAEAHEKARLTTDKLGILDTSLKTIEDRIAKMQTAREWLARAETRFEELNKEAQEELKLLEAVLKEEGKKSAGGKGAPAIAVRENAIRLRRQGWKVEEIARNLNISQGEVELILEMGLKD